MPVIRILPHAEYAPEGKSIEAGETGLIVPGSVVAGSGSVCNPFPVAAGGAAWNEPFFPVPGTFGFVPPAALPGAGLF